MTSPCRGLEWEEVHLWCWGTEGGGRDYFCFSECWRFWLWYFFFFFFFILAKLSWQPQACLDKCYTWGCANKWNQWISLFWLLIFSSKMIQSHADLLQAASVGKWNLCSVGQALCQHTGCCFSTIKQELCHTSHLITGFFRGLGWIRAPSQWLTVRGPFDRLHLQSHLKVMLAGPQWRRRRA